MVNCSCFTCFGRKESVSTSDPQQTAPSTTSEQRPSSQETPSSSPSLDKAQLKALEALNDVNKADELIQIIKKFLRKRMAENSVEDQAESSQSAASPFIDIGEIFFNFLSDHAEKPSSNKGDFMNSAPRIIGDILEKVGSLHWLGAGLSVIGYVLHTAHEMSENREKSLDLLQRFVYLFDNVKKLNYHLLNEEDKLKTATMLIVKGCILCSSQLCSHKLSRFLKSSTEAGVLSSLDNQIKDLNLDLILTTVVKGPVTYSQIPIIYPAHAVGLEKGETEVKKLLQLTSADTPVAVVIYGFGGIGKTTLAEAVVAAIKTDLKPYNYARVDFNLDSSKNDIKSFQEQIYNDLFRNNPQGIERKFRNCSEGRAVLTQEFNKEGNKPIFLFIDNAFRKQDLEELLPRDMKGLPKRSRILVTTRVLSATDMFIEDEAGLERQQYVVKPLSNQEAKIFLLKGRADRQPGNIQEEDVDRILNICKGVPLVLKIVRGHLRKQRYRADDCSQILEKLRTGEWINEEDLSKTLTDFVYDLLEESTKQSFMDICCFFYDMDPSHAGYLVGKQDLTSLEEAAFVQRSDDNKTLIVHDIIRERGQKKAGLKPTRIMDVKSLSDAAKKQRLEDIRGIWLVDKDESEDEPEYVVEEQHLKAMTQLRFLALGERMRVSHRCEMTFKELRYLRVGGDIPCLPVNLEGLPKLAFYKGPLFKKGFSFYKLPRELRVLIAARQSDFNESTDSESSTSIRAVENCSIEVCQLTMLTQLTLTFWYSLTCLPVGFGRLTALNYLNLADCTALQYLPESFGELKALKDLNLARCEALQYLPESFGELKALKDLNLVGCTALQYLPESFGELKALKDLNLACCTALQYLPESFGELKALKSLDLLYCCALERLPESFGQLAAIEELDVQECTALQSLPESFGELKALKYLNLDGCMQYLPESFGELKALKHLNLGCTALQCLPESFGELKALKSLDLSFCEVLKRLPESFGQLAAIEELDVEGAQLCSVFHNHLGNSKL